MPDRDPADGVVLLVVGRQAGAVHHVAGDLCPFIIEELVSPGAARTKQCHTGRAKAKLPMAAYGCFSSPSSRR